MKPIDKFTDVDCIYNFVDKEDMYTEYVWELVMALKPAQEDDEPFECSFAMPIFKQRYNDKLIKMPWSYEEYIKNQDIQSTINGLGYDVDKFWFALLFIYDYSHGECFSSQEFDTSPYSDIFNFAQTVSEYGACNQNPLKDSIKFKENIKLEIKVNNKTVYSIKSPNAIKYLANYCLESCEEFAKMQERNEENPMLFYSLKDELVFESNNYLIFVFTRLFKYLFRTWEMPKTKIRSRNGEVSYNKLFLISRLIYLTKISENEEFYYEPSTLKGYMSRYKNKGIKGRINSIYR